MGSPKAEQDAMVKAGAPPTLVEAETEHQVTLSKAFYCGKFEVTQGQWEQVMGNVWEWCEDWYGPHTSGEATNPLGPRSGEYRVRRGACFVCYARSCRSLTEVLPVVKTKKH